MIDIRIPGRGDLALEHLVIDYNGTMARDGELLPGVREAVESISSAVRVHVVTADTFGSAQRALAGVPCRVEVLPSGRQDEAKRDYVRELGVDRVACVGNGANDRLMLAEAALGVAVIQDEGCAVAALEAADVVCRSFADAIGLLQYPDRLVATLRS